MKFWIFVTVGSLLSKPKHFTSDLVCSFCFFFTMSMIVIVVSLWFKGFHHCIFLSACLSALNFTAVLGLHELNQKQMSFNLKSRWQHLEELVVSEQQHSPHLRVPPWKHQKCGKHGNGNQKVKCKSVSRDWNRRQEGKIAWLSNFQNAAFCLTGDSFFCANTCRVETGEQASPFPSRFVVCVLCYYMHLHTGFTHTFGKTSRGDVWFHQ